MSGSVVATRPSSSAAESTNCFHDANNLSQGGAGGTCGRAATSGHPLLWGSDHDEGSWDITASFPGSLTSPEGTGAEDAASNWPESSSQPLCMSFGNLHVLGRVLGSQNSGLSHLTSSRHTRWPWVSLRAAAPRLPAPCRHLRYSRVSSDPCMQAFIWDQGVSPLTWDKARGSLQGSTK